MDLVLLTALGVGGATLVGAILGFVFKKISHKFTDITLGFAAGVMLAAAVLGLVLPSLEYGGEYGIITTVAGIFVGAFCLNLVDKLVPHLHKLVGTDIEDHNNSNLSKVLLFVTAIPVGRLAPAKTKDKIFKVFREVLIQVQIFIDKSLVRSLERGMHGSA